MSQCDCGFNPPNDPNPNCERCKLVTVLAEQASEPSDAEQARWQHAIADKIAEFVPDVCADGCDSGDPLDWSLAEIGIALQTALETKEQATEPLTRERLKEFAKDNPPPDSWFEEEQASEVLEQIAERLRLRRRTERGDYER